MDVAGRKQALSMEPTTMEHASRRDLPRWFSSMGSLHHYDEEACVKAEQATTSALIAFKPTFAALQNRIRPCGKARAAGKPDPRVGLTPPRVSTSKPPVLISPLQPEMISCNGRMRRKVSDFGRGVTSSCPGSPDFNRFVALD